MRNKNSDLKELKKSAPRDNMDSRDRVSGQPEFSGRRRRTDGTFRQTILVTQWEKCLVHALLGVLLSLDDLLDSVVHFLHGLVLGQTQAALVGDVVNSAHTLCVLTVDS